MSDLAKRLRIKAGMIEMGELIAWGSDSALMREAADALELAAPDVQGEPVAWQLHTPDGRVILNKEFPEWADGGDGYKITPLYAAPQPAEQPTISAYACTVPDDCETLHWRGQILSMNELVSVAQPAVDEEIHVHIEGRDVLTLPLASSGMSAPRFVVHVPAQQPAERKPLKPSLAFDASVHLSNWLNMNLCECEGAHTCGYNDVKRTRDALLVLAEQQPAPDVEALVEALEAIQKVATHVGIRTGIQAGTALGCIAAVCDVTLAAHRKQGGEV